MASQKCLLHVVHVPITSPGSYWGLGWQWLEPLHSEKDLGDLTS